MTEINKRCVFCGHQEHLAENLSICRNCYHLAAPSFMPRERVEFFDSDKWEQIDPRQMVKWGEASDIPESWCQRELEEGWDLQNLAFEAGKFTRYWSRGGGLARVKLSKVGKKPG